MAQPQDGDREGSFDREDGMTEQNYDSTADTLRHIRRVQALLGEMCRELLQRGECHDDSKLVAPEKEAFDRETPLLKTLTFGSDEYKESLGRLGAALTTHYENNSHHPEHYADGVAGMDILDLVEMVADWKAASERQKGATLNLDYAFSRFEIEPQLQAIIRNTAARRGWLKA